MLLLSPNSPLTTTVDPMRALQREDQSLCAQAGAWAGLQHLGASTVIPRVQMHGKVEEQNTS